MTSDPAAVAPPSVIRPPSPALLLSIAAGAAAAAGVTVVVVLTSEGVTRPAAQATLYAWIILSYSLSGLVAWWRRPQSRFGALMVITGAVVFAATLSFSDHEPLRTVGQLFDVVPVVLLMHVFLAFPTGRLPGRLERRIVGAAYVVAVVPQVVGMAFGDTDNLLSVSASSGVETAAGRVQFVCLGALALAAITLLVVRRRAAEQALRRPPALLVYAFAVSLLMIAVLLLLGVLGRPGFDVARIVTLITVGLTPLAFLVGLLDARLTRSAVADLFVELRERPAPADLRAAIARALRDPSVALVYWLAEFDSWADLAGELVELPSPERRGTTMIDRDGEHVAAILHDPALTDEPELLASVGAAAGIALENARLHAELRAHLEELQRSRARVIEAGLSERKRLERNLHDGAQQRLIALSLELALLTRRAGDDTAMTTRLEHARGEVAASLEELRDVAHGLHPAVLTAHGLAVALESIAARAPVPVALDVALTDRLPEPVEVAAYYVVSESLANIGKHAHASRVLITVARSSSGVLVEVLDDGVGGADVRRGSGLRGLADRVDALGGRLHVFAPDGGGTGIRAELPCR